MDLCVLKEVMNPKYVLLAKFLTLPRHFVNLVQLATTVPLLEVQQISQFNVLLDRSV